MPFPLIFELSILLAFILDLLFADPQVIPHPVVIIGKGIALLEKCLRRVFPDTPDGCRIAGGVMAFLIPLTTFIVTYGLCIIAYLIHPALFFCLHAFWCWQAIAISGLAREAKNVYRNLVPELNLEEARKAVGRIVGRDTTALDEAGVMRAAVETIAENYSDGVAAPFFYMMIGGAPLAITYKSINTMDSMVGYKNDTYIDFGRHPAHLDDVAGYVPARLGALFWILAAALTGQNAKDAWKIWRRDNRNHASPNSAQTESACAGALGIQLAGPAYYFGKLYEKPTIGDALRLIEPEDINRTNRMLYAASVVSLFLCLAVGCWTLML